MNSVNITGRLTKDPTAAATQSGTSVASFSIAWSEPFGEKRTSFFDVTAFGKTADFAAKWLKKGTKVEVTGRLTQDRYTTRDGQQASKVKVIATELGFAESKTTDNAPAPVKELPQAEDFVEIPDDFSEELPFN